MKDPADLAVKLISEGKRRRAALGLPPQGLYSVPRRYDLWTLLVATAAIALMFAVMRSLQFTPLTTCLVALFFPVVGVSQALSFGGGSPRAASVVSGALFGFLATLLVGLQSPGRPEVLVFALFSGVWHGFMSYLVGALIGGVFLVAEAARNAFRRA